MPSAIIKNKLMEEDKMKLKTFKTLSFIWAIAFGILTLLAWYAKNNLGTIATL